VNINNRGIFFINEILADKIYDNARLHYSNLKF